MYLAINSWSRYKKTAHGCGASCGGGALYFIASADSQQHKHARMYGSVP